MSYVTAQEELQRALTTTFLSNLSLLYDCDRELYIKVDELSNMINEGIYKEKYILNFLEEEGDFDIYDVKNDKYLYNKKPKQWNDKVVNSFNMDENNSIMTLEKEVYSGKVFNDIIETKDQLQNIPQANKRTINKVSEIINVLDEKKDTKRILKKIPKTIFLGTLLGRHISRIVKKQDSELYLIVEKNLEIFRLSLFVLDYTILLKNKGVIFSIMEDSFTYEEKVINFLQVSPFDNYLIKLSTTDINVKDYLNSTLSSVLNTKPTSFDFNRILYNFVRNVSEKFSSGYSFLQLNKVKNNFTLLSNKPVLYIAAGPSTDENLNWIRDNQNRFFIVTVGAVVKKLLDNDIGIDMVFTLDPQAWVIKEKQFPTEIMPKLKDTIIMASIITYYEAIDKFNSKNLFIFEVFKSFLEDNIIVNVSSVGELGMAMLMNMNVKELYLIGVDFSLNKETGETHSLGTSKIKKYGPSNEKVLLEKEVYGLRTRVFDVKGNFESKVKTTGVFSSSIYHLNKILENKCEDMTVYNLSKHGAYFNNTIPTKVNDVIISTEFEKSNFRDSINKCLKSFTVTSLSDRRIKLLKNEVEYLENIKDLDILPLKKYSFTSYEEFFLLIKDFLIKLTSFSNDTDIFTILINNHTQIIFNYLNYVFNNRKIKKEIKKVEGIKVIYLEQVEELLNDYISYLKNIIQFTIK